MAVDGIRWRKGQETCQERKQRVKSDDRPGSNRCPYSPVRARYRTSSAGKEVFKRSPGCEAPLTKWIALAGHSHRSSS